LFKFRNTAIILTGVLTLTTAPVAAFATPTANVAVKEEVSAQAKSGEGLEGLNLIEADKYISQKDSAKTTKYKTADEVFAAHGRTAKQIDLSSLPKGTAVINVKSVDELDALLSGVSGSLSGEGEDIVINSNQSKDSNSTSKVTPAAYSGTMSSNMYDAKTWWIRLYSNYTVTNAGITDVQAYTGINGITLGITYAQNSASSTKITSKQWHTKGSGTYGLYIFLDGIGTFYSETVTGSHYVTIS
jgi:Tfp pilus assembly major pilin PilA